MSEKLLKLKVQQQMQVQRKTKSDETAPDKIMFLVTKQQLT